MLITFCEMLQGFFAKLKLSEEEVELEHTVKILKYSNIMCVTSIQWIQLSIIKLSVIELPIFTKAITSDICNQMLFPPVWTTYWV